MAQGRFAPARRAADIPLADLAEPGDWAYVTGYWWVVHHFNGNVVFLLRPGEEWSATVRNVQRWKQGDRSLIEKTRALAIGENP